MVIDKKKEYWTDIIRENPSAYEGKFVVHTDTDILFVSENMKEAENFLKSNSTNYSNISGLFLVPHHFNLIRLRMLKIKSLTTGEWTPTYKVKFLLDDGTESNVDMIVDTGADVTFIPKVVGEQLGLVRVPHEFVAEARGVGSLVPYLLRQMKVNIEGKTIEIRLLWGQDEQIEDVLLGRLDVFDHFDVLFSQKKREVIFIPNDTTT
jgi:predicted aspartyl protease